MKFAKELEQDLVPEWKAKYLNYKEAKKRLKAVGRAYKKLNATPRSAFQRITPSGRSPFNTLPPYTFGSGNGNGNSNGNGTGNGGTKAHEQGGETARKGVRFSPENARKGSAVKRQDETSPIIISKTRTNESAGSRLTRYGSIIGTPPDDSVAPVPSEEGGAPPSLLLPDPALQPIETRASAGLSAEEVQAATRRNEGGDAYNVRRPSTLRPRGSHSGTGADSSTRHMSLFRPNAGRTNSTPSVLQRTLSRRAVSMGGGFTPPAAQSPDVELASYREFDFRQAEFFDYLDKELDKIDSFYRDKEEEAMARMKVLREQLHILRDRRLEDLVRARRSVASKLSAADDAIDPKGSGELLKEHGDQRPWQRLLGEAKTIAQGGRVGKGSRAMEDLATPSQANLGIDARRDYSRRRPNQDIPYRTAKRKLKIAMQEFYRGLELLKSFALLNRTGFRKINKKYDKTVNAKPAYRYMNEKVNRAWFVESDVVDDLIKTVEDLYARYFERGNHKIAAGKLRAKAASAGDYTGSVFRTGAFLATGLVFGIQGLVYGAEKLFDPDPVLVSHTSFLLQIYAGYFLMLLLVQLFCLACRFWSYSKINYVFVFEFDTRHHLNWRQISELPCFCWFLLGLFMWVNFTDYGAQAMYIYYPVLLIGITVILTFLPLSYIYPKTRYWFLYSNWRLVLAGLYPVEFRDFFLGDMYCSQTYAMGNIELFFCLYAQDWRNPALCNSGHSRLLGFFSTLPGIWRVLQCIRRYADTRNAFPHLANCAKYLCTILFYMTLSLWRVQKTPQLKAVFITFATINAVYCSFWDLVMDWSLLDPYAKHRFLRDRLGYRQVWLYYLAIVIDPILRFNWIFYAIFEDNAQHSALLSFSVSLSEVGRRGLWMLFRVENEHCTNVGRFRASRDVPLPYATDSTESISGASQQQDDSRASIEEGGRDSLTPIVSRTSGADIETGAAKVPGTPAPPSPGSLRRRHTPRTPTLTPTLRTVGTMLRMAHAQDYAKKKKPEDAGDAEDEEGSSDDDDPDEGGDAEAQALRESADLEGYRNMREADQLSRGVGERADAGNSSGDS